MEQEAFDPRKTMLVIRYNGKEVGRIAATARNADDYIMELGRHYNDLEIDYVYDEYAGTIADMLGR